MAPSTVYQFHPDLPHVESISRILKLPIVEDGTQIAGNVYNRLKRSNSLMNWGFGTAERSLMVATTLATPAINVFNGPISAIDNLLCKGIDVVEEKVPAVNLPPSQMYSSAKDYMAGKIKPVLTRAESMTQIGSVVANATAERLNDALTNVEKRMDYYLPDDPSNKVDTVDATTGVNNTTLTIILSDRCIRKLFKVLVHMGKKFEAIIKLILTDPEKALQKLFDWERKMMFPGDLVKADTAAQSFVLLVNDARVYASHRSKEIVDTMFMFPVFIYAKIHPVILQSKRIILIVKTLLDRISVYSSRLVNTTTWKIHDVLRIWISRFLEIIVFLTYICPRGLMNLLHVPYEVNPNKDPEIIRITKDLKTKMNERLKLCTVKLVGERYIRKQMQGPHHQQNGIEMSVQTVRRRHSDLPHVESINRILKLPIVEDGTQIAGNVYSRIKRANSLMNWGLDTAERSFLVATTLATPAINVFNGPISAIDNLLCKGIDVVEEKVPAVHFPPSQIYSSAKYYMASKIKPVLTRAESMTQIVANATAERLNDALTNLEKRIDHYLPADPVDEVDYPDTTKNVSKTKLTVIHGVRCSRKLQRGLTRQTIAETRALMLLGKKFADIIKLVLTDPKLAMQQASSMWKALSLPEPENQVRPSTVEESLVLLLREISRWFVHSVNDLTAFVKANWKPNDDMIEIFRLWVETIISLRYYMLYSLIKLFLSETGDDLKDPPPKNPIEWLNAAIQKLLTRLAMIIAGKPDDFKAVLDLGSQQNHYNHAPQPTSHHE
ncbi:uncharacterized protein LOC143217845 [Lasioglossum baleicum]|uniref:uncharacterized protein LOC143217845 n=1 Tax=Lasioglossum baleicum TaxID=434251 RepID=UPI003FCEDF59